MTLREEQMLQVRQGSVKGRSASFCMGPADQQQQQQRGQQGLLLPAGDGSAGQLGGEGGNPARRSQSCRVAGPRPRVKRRDRRAELDLADTGSSPSLNQAGEPSYHPFLHKAPSCGKVFYQTADGQVMETYTPEGSPGSVRRPAGRRPPLPSGGTPEDSPSLARKSTRGRALAGAGPNRGSPSARYKRRANQEPDPAEDPDAYRLRNFSLTAKGIINRGDSFRVRRSSVQSAGSAGVPPAGGGGGGGGTSSPPPAASVTGTPTAAAVRPPPAPPVHTYTVALIGASGVGKTALMDQFTTSECTNAYDRERTADNPPGVTPVFIELDGEESELQFINIDNPKTDLDVSNPPDAFVVIYSVIEKSTFQRAEDELSRLQSLDLLRNRCLVLVGNKIDVVRSRVVSESDGLEVACAYNTKFIEISVGMNHNCDELLVGLLHQLRLKQNSSEQPSASRSEFSWTRNKGIVRASRKCKRALTRIFGKEDARLKNVTNFRVLN